MNMESIIRPPQIYLSLVSEDVGIGVFAARDFSEGELVEQCPAELVYTCYRNLPIELRHRVYSFDGLVYDPTKNKIDKSQVTYIQSFQIWKYKLRLFLYRLFFIQQLPRFIRNLKPCRKYRFVIAYGYAFMYNHNDNPNLRYKLSADFKWMMFYTIKSVKKHEQLTDNYNGKDGDDLTFEFGNDWFSGKNISKQKL